MIIAFLLFNLLLTFGNNNLTFTSFIIGILITIGLCIYYSRKECDFKQDDKYMALFILTFASVSTFLLAGAAIIDGNMEAAITMLVGFLVIVSCIQFELISSLKHKKIIPLFIASLISLFMFLFFIFTFDVKTVESYVNNEYMPKQYQNYMKKCSHKYINESDNRKSFHSFMFECIGVENKKYWQSYDEAVDYKQKQENIQMIEEKILKK